LGEAHLAPEGACALEIGAADGIRVVMFIRADMR